MSLSDLELIRRESLHQLRLMGIEPYPADSFEVNVSSKEIIENYDRNKLDYKNVAIAGRLMSKRIMGKASFAVVQDSAGRIQLYISRDAICPGEDKLLYDEVFKKHLDIGDIIGVK
ncbi:MAG: OB-fold nucleic acid binding domain-containing protein, partial [Bacteroidia bacterium]